MESPCPPNTIKKCVPISPESKEITVTSNDPRVTVSKNSSGTVETRLPGGEKISTTPDGVTSIDTGKETITTTGPVTVKSSTAAPGQLTKSPTKIRRKRQLYSSSIISPRVEPEDIEDDIEEGTYETTTTTTTTEPRKVTFDPSVRSPPGRVIAETVTREMSPDGSIKRETRETRETVSPLPPRRPELKPELKPELRQSSPPPLMLRPATTVGPPPRSPEVSPTRFELREESNESPPPVLLRSPERQSPLTAVNPSDVKYISGPVPVRELVQDVVDVELRNMGYVPIVKYLSRDPKNPSAEFVSYIKAYNPYGEIVYIQMDAEGSVLFDDTCVSEIRTEEPVKAIPYSTRISGIECAKFDVCGIAFECNGTLCTLKHDINKPGEFEETLKIFTPCVGGTKERSMVDTPILYPIIKLTELRSADPQLLLNLSSGVFRRYRNKLSTEIMATLNGVSGIYNDICDEHVKFVKKTAEIDQALSDCINTLEAITAEFRNKPKLMEIEDNKKKYRLALVNLAKRNELFEQLMRIVTGYNRTRSEASIILNELNKLNISYGMFDKMDKICVPEGF